MKYPRIFTSREQARYWQKKYKKIGCKASGIRHLLRNNFGQPQWGFWLDRDERLGPHLKA